MTVVKFPQQAEAAKKFLKDKNVTVKPFEKREFSKN